MKPALRLLLLLAAGTGLLSASIAYTLQPDSGYLSATTLLPITDPEQSMITSVSDGTLTISFLTGGLPTLMDVNSVPGSWATWGAPPDTESSTPMVVRPDDFLVTDIEFQFSLPLTAFGLELEPDDLSSHIITATFLFGGNPVGTLQRSVSGNGGALLFAASGSLFDSVSVSSDTDFAAAQFRYALAPADVPEPSPRVLVLVGLAAVVVWKGRIHHGISSAK